MSREQHSGQGESLYGDGFRILQGEREFVTYREHSSVRVWPSEVASHFDVHYHSAYEAVIPHRGKSIYHVQNQDYAVEPGQILIIPPGLAHTLTEGADTLRYLILFEPGPLQTLRDMPSIRTMMEAPVYLTEQNEETKEIAQLFTQMMDSYFRKNDMWNMECYSYLLRIFALLGREYLKKNIPTEQKASSLHVDPELLNSAMTYITENCTRNLTLDEVASFIGFSKYYFSRIFKEFAGITFSDFLTVKRVNLAASMLIRSDMPIREIAMRSGFGSVASFNRVFRDQKHCTPSQFRMIYGHSSRMHHGISLPREEE